MFTLIRLNLVVTVDTEAKRDKLIKAGYTLFEDTKPADPEANKETGNNPGKEPEKDKAPAKE